MNGQKHTYRYAAICIISELYFRQFCRAFGLREIIVMLNMLLRNALRCLRRLLKLLRCKITNIFWNTQIY